MLNPPHPLRQEAGGTPCSGDPNARIDTPVLLRQPLLVTRSTMERLTIASDLMNRVLDSFPQPPPAAPLDDPPEDSPVEL